MATSSRNDDIRRISDVGGLSLSDRLRNQSADDDIINNNTSNSLSRREQR